jgi:hypothetical protein
MNGMQTQALPQVQDLHVYYGKSHILHGVTWFDGKVRTHYRRSKWHWFSYRQSFCQCWSAPDAI